MTPIISFISIRILCRQADLYDGTKDRLEAGDVFYLPPAHKVNIQKDIKLIDFNPSKEFNEVITHVGKKMVELRG